jgi:hypothetical protein
LLGPGYLSPCGAIHLSGLGCVNQDLRVKIWLVSHLIGSSAMKGLLGRTYQTMVHRDREGLMGTAREWMSVAFYGSFWGGWMFLWERDTRIKSGLTFLYILGLSLASLGFGLIVTFRWRAFRLPLILVTGAFFVGAAVLGRSARRRVRPAE